MGDMPIGTSAPLPEAIAEYLAACEAEGQSRATLAWKRAVLRRFAHYADSVAAEDVGDLTLELARRWQRYLRTTPMARPRRKPGHEGERRAAHTVNGYCRVLRAFAGWLAEAEYVDAHPLGTFRPGRLPTREVEPIAADDQQRLLDACDPRSPLGLGDLAILSVLLDTGLRSSELCRLRVADLDLASGEVRVRGGKGARDRTVAPGQRARSMVDRYPATRAPVAGRPGPGRGSGISDPTAPAVHALHPWARAQAAGRAGQSGEHPPASLSPHLWGDVPPSRRRRADAAADPGPHDAGDGEPLSSSRLVRCGRPPSGALAPWTGCQTGGPFAVRRHSNNPHGRVLALQELLMRAVDVSLPALSPRERRFLERYATGQSIAAIGCEMGMSRSHLSSVYRPMVGEAVAVALRSLVDATP